MVQPNQQDPEFPPVEGKYSRRMHGMSLRTRNFGEKIKATFVRSRARLVEIKTLIYCPGHASPWLSRSKSGYRLKCFYQTPRITVTDRSRAIYIRAIAHESSNLCIRTANTFVRVDKRKQYRL